ncbi:MAG: hypothetical protein ABIH39_01540, partial [Candidatus Margulisiibacteriota bacterium]
DDGVLTKEFPGIIKEKAPPPPPPTNTDKVLPPPNDSAGIEDQIISSGLSGIDYGAIFADIQAKDPEGLIKACDEMGYGANLVIPLSEAPRKRLHDIYLKIKEGGKGEPGGHQLGD